MASPPDNLPKNHKTKKKEPRRRWGLKGYPVPSIRRQIWPPDVLLGAPSNNKKKKKKKLIIKEQEVIFNN
jgi:hypothetical protein